MVCCVKEKKEEERKKLDGKNKRKEGKVGSFRERTSVFRLYLRQKERPRDSRVSISIVIPCQAAIYATRRITGKMSDREFGGKSLLHARTLKYSLTTRSK